jgi:hypothetical protein
MMHCDQTLCRTRRFGIGAGAAPSIVSITRLMSDPPLYFVSLEDGTTVECSVDDLLNSRTFQRTVLIQTGQLLPMYKQDNFQNKISTLLDQAIQIEVPKEVSVKGIFESHLETFLTDQYAAKTLEEVLLGKPFHDEENKQYWFHFQDFWDYLEKKKFKDYKPPQIYKRFKDMGGGSKFKNLNGRGINLWCLPETLFDVQTDSFTTPRVKDSPV